MRALSSVSCGYRCSTSRTPALRLHDVYRLHAGLVWQARSLSLRRQFAVCNVAFVEFHFTCTA